MPPLLNCIVLVCLGISCVLALVDLLRLHSPGRSLLELGLLLLTGAVLFVTTGFPRPALRESFGAGSGSVLVIGLMFLCIALGMAARYFFYLRGPFSWLPFVKPLCLSPIVLLPLLGTFQTAAELSPVQVISFCLLAFQNGFFWRVVFERAQAKLGKAGLRTLLALMLAFLPARSEAEAPPDVQPPYAQFFVHYVDGRSLGEKALNLVGLSSRDVGRSFALVAGVDIYPKLPRQDRLFQPAAFDLQNLVKYLREVESFDEIVFLHNEAVTDENFKYFLQAYFPERLRSFPKSRFLFAYSGHGIQDGPRGYLLQYAATSLHDKANSISLEVLSTLYGEIVDSAHRSLALINACYSGAFARRSFGPEQRRLVPTEPGAHVITAGGRELTWHDPLIGPGSIFFEKLFVGLGGLADTEPVQKDGSRGDGIISVPELYAYLFTEIQLETNKAQKPLVSDISRNGSGGSFFFFTRRRQSAAGLMRPWEPKRAFGEDAALAPDQMAAEANEAFAKGHFDEAADGFRKACDAGSNRGCASLGRMYLRGLGGLAPDEKIAGVLFREACDQGDAQGCSALGVSYAYGQGGLASDAKLAVELYRRACDKGDARGCRNLGVSYQNGLGGLVPDAKRGVEILQKACAASGAEACDELGVDFQNGKGGLPSDAKRAIELFRKACDGGDERGCSDLGHAYELGLGGLAPDAKKAVDLYRWSCDRGDASGCTNLGLAYDVGKGGLTPDLKMAVPLYKKACDWGDLNAGCSHLALAYEKGGLQQPSGSEVR